MEVTEQALAELASVTRGLATAGMCRWRKVTDTAVGVQWAICTVLPTAPLSTHRTAFLQSMGQQSSLT
jgi:hypothetical protein